MALNPYEFWHTQNKYTSDLYLPIGYSLPNFQLHRSNFWIHFLWRPPPSRRRPDQMEGGRHVKKTVPVRFLDPLESFATTKLFAIWFTANLDQLLIDSRESKKITRKWTSNHCIPIGVLTHQNSLVTKESYWKVLDRTEKKLICTAKCARTCNWIFFGRAKKYWMEWCSHMTFDTKNILRSYR